MSDTIDMTTLAILITVALALGIAIFLMWPKRKPAKQEKHVTPPKAPTQPEQWPEFTPEHDHIRDALIARRSSSARVYRPLAAQSIPAHGLANQQPQAYFYETTAGSIPMPLADLPGTSEWTPISLPDPSPDPLPTFGGGDSGGAGASMDWSPSSSSSDTSSSYDSGSSYSDSSSSSCDSSSGGDY